jgi:hypothetical protein
MKSIGISDNAHKQVKKFCQTLGITIGEFVEYSAIYFRSAGIDPSKSDAESPHKVVKELEKRISQIVGVMKTHEREKLDPLLENLIILKQQLEDLIIKAPKAARFEDIITRINELREEESKNQKEQAKLITTYMDAIKTKTTGSVESLKKETTVNIASLKKSIDNLITEQQKMNEVIETKLSKKLFNTR